MSNMLFILQPPVPVSFDFEHTFSSSSHHSLLALSALRSELGVQTRALVLANNRRHGQQVCAHTAVSAARAYRTAWTQFLAEVLSKHGTLRSALGTGFPWQVPLPSHADGSVLFADASVLFESACVSLALAAALQALGSDDSLREASDVLRSTAKETLVHFRPRIATARRRVRESHVLSDTVFEAYAHGIEGQRASCSNSNGEQHDREDENRVSVYEHTQRALHLFNASTHYRRALELMPAERALVDERTQITARARYHLARALVEGPGEFGVAIACLEEALGRQQLLSSNHESSLLTQKIVTTLKDMRRLNNTAAFQEVPIRTALSMRIDRTGTIHTVTVQRQSDDTEKNIVIILPAISTSKK